MRLSPGGVMVLIVLSGALAFFIVAVVLSGNARTATTGYYGIVADLSASAVADIALLAPVDVLQSCLRGEESGCAQQAQNAQAVAARLGQLANGIGANTPTFDATIWQSAYLTALGDLRVALGAQVVAIEARDRDAFAAAVETTRAAVAREEELTAEFNQRFAGDLSR
jgi:hypothetical protein